MSARVVIVGAGPAGCHAALAFLKTGAFNDVQVFEKRPRNVSEEKGRNINITLCKRGLDCLQSCGICVTGQSPDEVEPGPTVSSVPMTHFKLHGRESSIRLPYKDCIPDDMPSNQGSATSIQSVRRNELYDVLVEACEKAGIKIHFEHQCTAVELIPVSDRTDQVNVHKIDFLCNDGRKMSTTAAIVVGADGVHSDVARYIVSDKEVVDYDKNVGVKKLLSKFEQTRILENCQIGYREVSVPHEVSIQQGLELDTFHIWANEEMVILGLPSSDGNMTIGIYGPTDKMKRLHNDELIADIVQEFPNLGRCFDAVSANEIDRPNGSYTIGKLLTAINPNLVKDGVVLIGDAGHAMLPFLGQGLNSGLEDSKIFLLYIENWTDKVVDGEADVKSLHSLMRRYNSARKVDIHVIQEQSRCELERLLSMQKMMAEDLNPASFALSRFFYYASFSSLLYGEAWRRSKPKKISVGATVEEGEILAQVESVKTLISVIAPRSGRVTGVKEQSHGVPAYEITPRKGTDSDMKIDSPKSAVVVETPSRPTGTRDQNQSIWETQKEDAPFDLPVFQKRLKTRYIGQCVLYNATTGSTMDDGKELAKKGCVHGTMCLAETMTAGRGRQGNKWMSPPKGNLYVTVVMRIHQDQEDQIKNVQFATAVAICLAVRQYGLKDAVVKWPNDIWVRGHKLAGVLIEVCRFAAIKDEAPSSTAILVGFGINVNDNPRLNKDIRENATSISNEIGHHASRETILADICNNLEYQCDLDMATILETFQSMHIWKPGSTLEVIPKDKTKAYQGVMEDIELDGTLKITDDGGKTQYLSNIGLSVRPVPESVVYVYSGYGHSDQSLQMLCTSLKMFVDTSKYCVKMIGADELIEGAWTEKAALIAFGGGFDCGYIDSLGERGIAVIQEYVTKGGNYLGICAGGYFGCTEIEFDKGGELEVCGGRDLQFFPGKCVGPVFPGFVYDSEEGAHAAEVVWKLPAEQGQTDHALHAYFNGGGAFIIPESSEDDKVEVIAHYTSIPEKPAAVLKCKVGAGVAVLSGIHFEYIPQDLNITEGSPLVSIVPQLLSSQEMCIECFKSVLNHLSVK